MNQSRQQFLSEKRGFYVTRAISLLLTTPFIIIFSYPSSIVIFAVAWGMIAGGLYLLGMETYHLLASFLIVYALMMLSVLYMAFIYPLRHGPPKG